MNIDEITLLAYVDQQLPQAQRVQIEAALAQSADLRAQVASLQASRLPYSMAFDAQALPAIPAALAVRLEALTAGAASQTQEAVAQAQSPASSSTAHRRSALRSSLSWGAGLAASFVLGWVLRPVASAGGASPSLVAEAWVDAVANYQAMYTRATVDQTSQSLGAAQAVLAEFSSAQQTLSVPDLSSEGLQFKRAQRLTFREQPLLQMAYLPSQGKPTALCVLKRSAAQSEASAVAALQLHGLTVVTWARGALAYALATEMPAVQALALGKRLAAGQVPSINS